MPQTRNPVFNDLSAFCFLFLIFGIFMPLLLPAQETPPIETLLENLENEQIGQVDFLEILKELEDHPININQARVKDLLRIPFLNLPTARNIISYRNQNGPYRNALDLKRVSGVSEELLKVLLPLIQFRPPERSLAIDYRVQTAGVLHKVRGFEEGVYGNPLYLYQRLRWQWRTKMQFGFLMEKDAGEREINDFGSLYLQLLLNHLRSELLLGDFNLEVGQRIVFGSAYGLPLSLNNTLPFSLRALRWRAQLSVNENAFLRGFLWEHTLSPETSLLFTYSIRNLDATLSEDQKAIRSLYTSGLHRTQNEKEKRGRLTENLLSGILTKRFLNIQAGILFNHVEYSLPVLQSGKEPRTNYDYLSGFYTAHSGILTLQGELVFLNGEFPAFQQSLLLKTKQVSYGVLAYSYHPHYWALHGRAFGRIGDTPINERGYFLSLSTRLLSRLEFSGFLHVSRPIRAFDEFAFLKRTYQFKISGSLQNTQASLRYSRRHRKSIYGRGLGPEQHLHSVRIQIESPITRKLKIRQRVEVSWIKPFSALDRNLGINLYLDVRYFLKGKSYVQTRWSQFDIPDFDLRLYEFENDLPGNFRNVLLNGRGYKWFLLMNIPWKQNLRLAIKYQEIFFPDATTLSSGLDTILGNRRREFRAQLQILY